MDVIAGRARPFSTNLYFVLLELGSLQLGPLGRPGERQQHFSLVLQGPVVDVEGALTLTSGFLLVSDPEWPGHGGPANTLSGRKRPYPH